MYALVYNEVVIQNEAETFPVNPVLSWVFHDGSVQVGDSYIDGEFIDSGSSVAELTDGTQEKELAVDEVLILSFNTSDAFGKAKYADNTVDFNFKSGVLNLPYNAGFGKAKDTVDKVNIYLEGGDVKIQNKTSGTITLSYYLK